MKNTSYHLKNIRALLTSGFSDAELRELCFDTPALRPVYDQFGASTGKAEMAAVLLEYADRTLQLDLLLSLLKERNPARYERHQPYRIDESPSIDQKSSPSSTETSPEVQTYSCFISYSSRDEAFASQLHTDLEKHGVRCWIDRKNMKIGDKIRSTIHRSIQAHDKLLLILSENSIDSAWVESEVETAFEKEMRSDSVVLFPIRLDEAVMETDQAWAADIRRTRHIGNFTRWHDQVGYQQAFERLLGDLQK